MLLELPRVGCPLTKIHDLLRSSVQGNAFRGKIGAKADVVDIEVFFNAVLDRTGLTLQMMLECSLQEVRAADNANGYTAEAVSVQVAVDYFSSRLVFEQQQKITSDILIRWLDFDLQKGFLNVGQDGYRVQAMPKQDATHVWPQDWSTIRAVIQTWL